MLAGVALLGVAILAGFAASEASGQTAFCQQYPDNPSCQGDTGPGGGDGEGDGLLPDLGGGDTGTGAADGVSKGELPFTGYPLTGLLLLLLLLLLMGVALRAGLAARDRLQARTAEADAKASL